ncbi:hypothetical protein FOA52_005413 [Chlamydomonas sp. UWO 241]|nr:hypothetical protein FOA52_005413 [Chlamydomonas sp. UWO 241]
MQAKCAISLSRHSLSLYSSAAAASSSEASTSSSVAQPMLTLERAILGSAGNDTELASCGLFAGEVFPDLPIATTWEGLRKAVLGSFRTGDVRPGHDAEERAVCAMKVSTVGVNLRSMREVEHRVRSCASHDHFGDVTAREDGRAPQQQAGALLFVSGTHPVRSLPGVKSLLHTSIDALKLASELRAKGDIPEATQLWCVANPNTERDASLLEAKIAAGATVVLTQPPLDFEAFEAWMGDARARGLTSKARVLCGAPMLSSPANVAFWIALADCGSCVAARQLLADFQAGTTSGDKASALAFVRRYNEAAVARALSTPGVAGLHVMPLTGPARRLALEFAWEGRFGAVPTQT